ncbi:MAG: efflux RND transporter periplasmic adaptor subunit [Rhodobacterales bacterium]|nr:efflux RND transporter periplasmic adaptor subunit [Rhodobacterales bacterium]NCT11573.1 efflux RND transporter periplasmic adaptor subunit [Rhodobacterales bacterium]
MKLMPLVTSLLVTAALYMLVVERDALLAFAQVTPAEETEMIHQASDGDMADAVRVVAIHSVAQEIDSAVVLRGRTEAAREVQVQAELSGQVISEPLRKGAFVNAGDILCVLDPGTRQSALSEAEARLSEARGRVPEAEAAQAEAAARVREAEINLNAARQLSEGGFASETRVISAEAALEAALAGVQRGNSSVISAQAAIESAQAAVASAALSIERLTIRAPFAGLLETDTAELGALMQTGAPCATVIQLDPIKLVGFVPEIDVAKVTVGAPAGARLTSGEELIGRVTFLSRSADETTRTFRVEVAVPNSDLSIRDGQTAEILVQTDGQSAHLIAQSALTLDDAGRLGVRSISDTRTAAFLPVTLVRDTPQGVWVAGLPDKVDIIVVGQEFVIDGVPVNPTFREAN